MSKGTVQVLREAREFLSDESRWLRNGHYGMSAEGLVLDPFEDDMGQAVRCCAIGACVRARGAFDTNVQQFLFAHGFTIHFNDVTATHQALLSVFDSAIKSAEVAGAVS